MTSYKIVRFYKDERPSETIKTGLNLDDARKHCNDGTSHGTTEDGSSWFDGYVEE